MILHEIVGSEADPRYEALAAENLGRQYDFLRSLVNASIAVGRPMLSAGILNALNFHAIACLHTSAGKYRPCKVIVGKPPNHFEPPEWFLVDDLMDDFINIVNQSWVNSDPVMLAAFVLWRLNNVHPFINGNGRTARAACYFVLCVKLGQWLPGTNILPELIRQNRPEYVAALKAVDASAATGAPDLRPLYDFLAKLLAQQFGVQPPPPQTPMLALPPPGP